MLSSRLARSVKFPGSFDISSKLTCEFKLPRATTAFSRSPITHSPILSSFVRYQSSGGEEKVKGQVIGIDLGMLSVLRLASLPFTYNMIRHNQFCSRCFRRQNAQDNRKRRRYAR